MFHCSLLSFLTKSDGRPSRSDVEIQAKVLVGTADHFEEAGLLRGVGEVNIGRSRVRLAVLEQDEPHLVLARERQGEAVLGLPLFGPVARGDRRDVVESNATAAERVQLAHGSHVIA